MNHQIYSKRHFFLFIYSIFDPNSKFQLRHSRPNLNLQNWLFILLDFGLECLDLFHTFHGLVAELLETSNDVAARLFEVVIKDVTFWTGLEALFELLKLGLETGTGQGIVVLLGFWLFQKVFQSRRTGFGELLETSVYLVFDILFSVLGSSIVRLERC